MEVNMSENYSKEDIIRMEKTEIHCICTECNSMTFFPVFDAIADKEYNWFQPCEFCGSEIAFSTENKTAIDSIKRILIYFGIKYPNNIQVVKPKSDRQLLNYYRAKQQEFMKKKSCPTCDKFSDCSLVRNLNFKACDRKVEPIKITCPCIAACKLFINGFSDLCKKRSNSFNGV